jgi:hypothetical protein
MSTSMKGMQPENRPVTANERCLIEWLLRHGNPGSDQFLRQVDALVAVSKCSCGCPTVYFAQESGPVVQDAERILADYLATVNGEDVEVILFQRGGRLSSLEVYSQAGTDKPFGLPELETLYSHKELPERQRKHNRPRVE